MNESQYLFVFIPAGILLFMWLMEMDKTKSSQNIAYTNNTEKSQ